jgi:hypothetical protein
MLADAHYDRALADSWFRPVLGSNSVSLLDKYKLFVANTVEQASRRTPELVPFMSNDINNAGADIRVLNLSRDIAPLVLAKNGDSKLALALAAGPSGSVSEAYDAVVAGLGQRMAGEVYTKKNLAEPDREALLARLGYSGLLGGVGFKGAYANVKKPAVEALFRHSLESSPETALAVLSVTQDPARLLNGASMEEKQRLATLIEPRHDLGKLVHLSASYSGDAEDLVPAPRGSGGKVGQGISSMYYPEYLHG